MPLKPDPDTSFELLNQSLTPASFLGGLSVVEKRGYCRWRFRGWMVVPYVCRAPEERELSRIVGRLVVVTPEGLLFVARVLRLKENDRLICSFNSKGAMLNFVRPVDARALEWLCLDYWLSSEDIAIWPGKQREAIDSVRLRLTMGRGGELYEIS